VAPPVPLNAEDSATCWDEEQDLLPETADAGSAAPATTRPRAIVEPAIIFVTFRMTSHCDYSWCAGFPPRHVESIAGIWTASS